MFHYLLVTSDFIVSQYIYIYSQGAGLGGGRKFSGKAGNDFFSKFIPPRDYFDQNKILLPGAFRRIQDGRRRPYWKNEVSQNNK